MKLVLHFSLPRIGDVTIETNSEHGSYDRLVINGEDLTEDGEAVLMVTQAIDQKLWIFSMFTAQYEGHGIYRQSESA